MYKKNFPGRLGRKLNPKTDTEGDSKILNRVGNTRAQRTEPGERVHALYERRRRNRLTQKILRINFDFCRFAGSQTIVNRLKIELRAFVVGDRNRRFRCLPVNRTGAIGWGLGGDFASNY